MFFGNKVYIVMVDYLFSCFLKLALHLFDNIFVLCFRKYKRTYCDILENQNRLKIMET